MTRISNQIQFRPIAIVALCLLASLTSLVPQLIAQQSQAQDSRLLGHDAASSTRQRRIALVIGNGVYQNTKRLKNPPNDAALLAATLKKLGFEVTVGTDKSQREMRQLIRDFGRALRGSDVVGLFYFAGHGVQSRGRNYLIPVDADIQTEADLEDTAVNLNYVLDNMDDAQNALNIAILDACRNNSFARSFRSAPEGLAHVNAPTGTLIAYATAPGSTAADGDGANSPYTEELTRQMQTSGVFLETMFRRVAEKVSSRTGGRQEPWFSANVKGDFYFSGGPNVAEATGKPPTPTSGPLAPGQTASSDPQPYYARSMAYLNRGDFDEALVEINKAIELSPTLAAAYVVRGGLYHLKNNHDDAIADSNKAIELKLVHEGPYLVRGSSYNMQGKYDLALADFNKAIQINPQSGPAYSGRGVAYCGKGDYDKGIAEYSRGIALVPNDAQAYYNRGTAYANTRDFDRALADFNKTIELNPNLAVAYNNRAVIYEKKGDAARAASDKKKYLELIGFK